MNRLFLIFQIASTFIYNAELTLKILEAHNFVEEVFNFWIPKLDKLNFNSQRNKSLIGFMAIICINPQSQNEKVKLNINHLIHGLLGLVKLHKNKSSDKKQDKQSENDEDEFDEENENKFNVHILILINL